MTIGSAGGSDGRGSGFSLRLLGLLLVGPLLALLVADRALVLWPGHWAWVVREVPPRVLDPYLVEGLLRTTPPGRHNVPILGNSIADRGLDSALLEQRFAAEGLRFPKLVVGGSPALTAGMLAGDVAELEPRAAIFVASAPALRTRTDLGRVHAYDVRAVPELFSRAEVLSEPEFHFTGLFGELSIFSRHRRALRKAALVALGQRSWRDEELAVMRARLEQIGRGDGDDGFETWLRDREPDVYPNVNSAALARLARTLHARGARLIVVDAPVHPIPLVLGAARRLQPYRDALAALAIEADFELIGADRLPKFEEDHFDDWVHLNPDGQLRLTHAVADAVAVRIASDP